MSEDEKSKKKKNEKKVVKTSKKTDLKTDKSFKKSDNLASSPKKEKVETKPEIKKEEKAETKPEVKKEEKAETKPEVKKEEKKDDLSKTREMWEKISSAKKTEESSNQNTNDFKKKYFEDLRKKKEQENKKVADEIKINPTTPFSGNVVPVAQDGQKPRVTPSMSVFQPKVEEPRKPFAPPTPPPASPVRPVEEPRKPFAPPPPPAPPIRPVEESRKPFAPPMPPAPPIRPVEEPRKPFAPPIPPPAPPVRPVEEPAKPTVLEAEIVSGVKPKKVEESESFSLPKEEIKIDSTPDFEQFDSNESFWDILEEAGISKSVFFWIIGGFVFIISLIVFFIFGGYSLIFGASQMVNEPEKETEIIYEPDPSSGESVSGNMSSTIGSIEIGREFPSGVSGVLGSLSGLNASFVVGDEFNSKRIDLINYLKLVGQMQNIYRVDIYAYLDRNSARRESLETLLADMRLLLEDSGLAQVSINRTLDGLDLKYSPLLDKRDSYENLFFNSLDNFKGSEAYNNLELFIDFSQDAVSIKAYFGAYSGVLDMINQMRTLLKPRYDDIVVNKEALIKGIRVFDIPGSDIDSIVPLKYLD